MLLVPYWPWVVLSKFSGKIWRLAEKIVSKSIGHSSQQSEFHNTKVWDAPIYWWMWNSRNLHVFQTRLDRSFVIFIYMDKRKRFCFITFCYGIVCKSQRRNALRNKYDYIHRYESFRSVDFAFSLQIMTKSEEKSWYLCHRMNFMVISKQMNVWIEWIW